MLAVVFLIATLPFAFADVYINVMAVNGTQDIKTTTVKFDLPGDLSSGDILDTGGLSLDYNVNDANYYVHGKVTLAPKESKTFRIRVQDIWRLSPQQIDDIKKEIDQGYEEIGKVKDPKKGELLKEHLLHKLDFIVQEESTATADTVEKRMDAFRAYSNELKRIEDSALDVNYWRSDPSNIKDDKIIHFNIEVENPFDVPKPYKHKHYLPSEIRPEDLVEFDGFEVRFDQDKKQVFLYKEDNLQPKEKKIYTIGIRDIWFIPQKDIDYLRNRSNYAYEILKESKYGSMAKTLFGQISSSLKDIENSQAQKRDSILEHISVFRDNQKTYNNAKINVEDLEKLLSILREDLEKSKVKNVLEKIRSLKGVGEISKAIFDKTKPAEGAAWNFIGLVLIFVAFITIINFVIWFIRSKKTQAPGESDNQQTPGEKKTQ